MENELSVRDAFVWDAAVLHVRQMPRPMYEMLWVDGATLGAITTWASLS